MADSIERKAFLLALVVAAPPVIAICLFVDNVMVRLASLLSGILLIVIAFLIAQSLSRRIISLTDFANRLLDLSVPRLRLQTGDDELGDLARSLLQIAPKIEELFSRLSTELTRREAILASMTEAVLAVDDRLSVTFCNAAFVKAVGDHGSSEGVPLIKLVRDPALFRILKHVVETGDTDS